MKHYQSKTTIDRDRIWRDRLKVIAGLLEQGLTLGEVAQRVGLSEGWVRQLACVYGLTAPAGAEEPSLSQRQTEMLAFIQDYIAKYSHPPTTREITVACRISSTSVTDYNLRLLEHRNYLTRMPGSARSIVLTERGRSWQPNTPEASAAETAA